MTPAQAVIKIVNEELTALMGQTQSHINISPKAPTIIMMVGLQGAGKTTSAGKLGLMFKKARQTPIDGCSRYLSSSSYQTVTGTR